MQIFQLKDMQQKDSIKLARFSAAWHKFGRSAGPIRNEKMAKYSIEDNSIGVLIAFWDGKP